MKYRKATYRNLIVQLPMMKLLLIFGLLFCAAMSSAQDKDQLNTEAKKLQKSNNYVYQGNELVERDDFVAAEMEYRKAISEKANNVAGTYNLGNSYFEKGNYDEALYRHTQAAENATSKAEKHKAYHNIGNILMKKELCKEAVEAYKNALRNDPSDDETRYNLALAKDCAEQQQDEDQQQEKEGDKENEEEDKEEQKNEEQNNQDDQNKDNEDEQKKDGDDQKDDQGQPKDDKKDQGKEGQDKEEQGQPQRRPGQLSPQQIKNLLEAMNNQEQKVQKKINAEKQKGQPVRTEKDW